MISSRIISRNLFSALLLLSGALPCFVSAHTSITVSIIGFENSDAAKKDGYLNKSLTEMVTVDLVGVRGVTLVERADIEKILREQALSLTGAIDEASAPKVGMLLGVRYLVSGTYSISRRRIAIHYKVTDVETGAIEQAGSTRGRLRQFIRLKNLLAISIYNSLRVLSSDIGGYTPVPDYRGFTSKDAVEYGRALDLGDKGEYEKARAILKRFEQRKTTLTYIGRSLVDVEKRMAGYEKEHRRVIDGLAAGPLTYDNFIKTVNGYIGAAEYSKCITYCREVRDRLPKAPQGSITTTRELCDHYLVMSYHALGEWDSTISRGEAFLESYPGSMYFAGSRQMVNSAVGNLEERNRASVPPPEIAAMMKEASLVTGDDAVLLFFRIAAEWFAQGEWSNALEWFKKVDPSRLPRAIEPDLVVYQIFMCYYNLKDRENAQTVVEFTLRNYPSSLFNSAMRQLIGSMPH